MGGFHQDRQSGSAVAPLAMGEAMEVLRGGFHADGNAHRLQVHVHERGQVRRALMGHDGVDHRIFRGGLVQINRQINFLAPNQFGDAEGDLLRQCAVGRPG